MSEDSNLNKKPKLDSDQKMMSQKIQNIKGLYLEGIQQGNIEEAINKYTGDRYTQHSTGVADGREGFIKFFKSFTARNPDRDIKLRVIEDGRYCFCHASQSLNGGEAKWVTMDLFDSDKNEKIVEHWDCIQEWKDAEGRSMVEGETTVKDVNATQANKNVVRRFLVDVLQCRDFASIPKYVDSDNYVDHNTSVDDLEQFLTSKPEDYSYEMVFRVIGEGNFVVSYSKAIEGDEEFAVFDLFRLESEKIVEHWDVREKILDRSQWGNTGKF
mmetsp:Transcript_7766/g.8909  ORF Transcript_7766/g.8909 Transcript_7766/m.8909 type:complete len:270 (+) Transcript_7766:170-979(+)